MNNEIEKKLWRRVDNYLSVLQMVPFVRMVAVCNNLAFGKVDEDSDIDLFIVAKPGRLFFVRTFVTVLLHLLGVRRHGRKIAGRFCLSFFVDEAECDLSKIAIKDDLYLAYWIKSMKPVIVNGFADIFYRENSWAKDYFANSADFGVADDRILSQNPLNAALRSLFSVAFTGFFGDFLEKRLASWQKKRALKKASVASEGSSLIVTEHMLKFHNTDRRKYYRDLWRDKYGDKKLTTERFLAL